MRHYGVKEKMLKGGNRFFFDFSGKKGLLPQDEAHHLIRVYRKKEGEEVILINGKGKEFLGEILRVKEKGRKIFVEVELLQILREEKSPFIKCFALVPALKGDKTDFLIEKGTELGITGFIIYHSTFTIPKITSQKILRLREKALSALKQSGRLTLPEMEISENLKETLQKLPHLNCLKILASTEGKLTLEEVIKEIKSGFRKIFLLSGPEGGLSSEEREEALKKGFLEISLSPHILRAETASFALMSLFAPLIYKKI
jgi:16S rRNA (uracil1498-N3)-methyltransferase